MIEQATCIQGGIHTDERGQLSFVNNFDMSQVKRFYRIKHFDTHTVRGWRAHKVEQRWFHVFKGCFRVRLVAIDNWDSPNKSSKQTTHILKASDCCVLHVPVGYASSLKAIEAESEMIVFGDYPIEHATKDDHVFPSDYFNNQHDLLNEN